MTTTGPAEISQTIASLYRNDWARILATLVRDTRDIDAAEDALQEAIARAIASWPRDGVPENPAGWVSVTARRIALDVTRRGKILEQKLPLLIISDEAEEESYFSDLAFGDDRLRLIFTCCHPVLAPESRLALTLRLVCGVSTADIAALFMVQEATIAARITRAKKKLATSGVPYRIPLPTDLYQRLKDVLSVVYLVATSAHTPGSGEGLHNTTHMQLALDLSRVLHELIPTHPEVMSLRALVLLAEARKESRIDATGNALPLEQMDRSRWDPELIAQARYLTEQGLLQSQPDTVGPYTLQAAIAMVHADAVRYEETDWVQIAALYAILDHRHPGPIVRLGFAIAIGMRDTPAVGIAMIDGSNLDEQLAGYPMLPAARAFLYRRAGKQTEAAHFYRQAAERTANQTLAAWLTDQANH